MTTDSLFDNAKQAMMAEFERNAEALNRDKNSVYQFESFCHKLQHTGIKMRPTCMVFAGKVLFGIIVNHEDNPDIRDVFASIGCVDTKSELHETHARIEYTLEDHPPFSLSIFGTNEQLHHNHAECQCLSLHPDYCHTHAA